jgi:tRNA nucleotidyltransferase (CCA-adding enzyme)
MRVYCVGGSVRDELLGRAVTDRDWVVVDATPEEMERLGYTPVGKDFPVFLHPQTKEEYALARTERKVARGYKGFEVYTSPQVTLEQDLARRDLTINAIACDETGKLIDPYGGVRDLHAGVLRHVSPAFAEDPVRILRVARFAARYGFKVAPETQALMRSMVERGEAEALVSERVWQELARGLMEADPWRMIAVLAECGLLARLLPELALEAGGGAAASEHSRIVCRALGIAAERGFSLAVRFALLTRGARSPRERLVRVCARLKVPVECRDFALLAARALAQATDAERLDARGLLELLQASDAFRRPQRLHELLCAAECEVFAVQGRSEDAFAARHAAYAALAAAQAVDAAALARRGGDIAGRLRRMRREAIDRALDPSHPRSGR